GEKGVDEEEKRVGVGGGCGPVDSRTIFAVMWSARQGPWENGAWQGDGSGLFKSTDGGTTWRPLTKGLPTAADGLGRIGIAVAPSEPKRLFAIVDAPRQGGLYRSDDARESRGRGNAHPRPSPRGGDLAAGTVRPESPHMP